MSDLAELLRAPSIESWEKIVQIGKNDLKSLLDFTRYLQDKLSKWPPEIERVCPKGWPKEFRDAVENRPRETDTYGHYVAKICGHPDLRLSDGSQAVWLERRFTGGVVQVSTAQQALRAISAALSAPSAAAQTRLLEQARNILSNGVRNVGRVGCADLTGGLTVEQACVPCGGTGFRQWGEYVSKNHVERTREVCLVCGGKMPRHEYRLEVEVKVGDEEQRSEQVARMRSIRARGGCYVLARSVEEAVAEIKRFRDGR